LAKHVLLSIAIILAAGTFSGLLAKKLKVPDVVVSLLVGMLLGPELAGILTVKVETALNQFVLIFGACYILFDGGASLRFSVLKEVWITIVVIATFGVLITGAITSLAAYYVLGIPFMVALLLGATIASTDPATLVPVFRQIKIKQRVAATVISESAFNDAVGAIATFAVLGVAMGTSEFSVQASLVNLFKECFFGVLVGAIFGYLAALLISHEKFDFLSEYGPIVSLVAVIGAYLTADYLHASGFMAVFVLGLVFGNKESFGFKVQPDEQKNLEEFVMTTALVMRIFIFMLLGAQVDFSLLNEHLVGGIAVVTVFMLVARPLTVFLCALPDRRAKWTFNEMLFMCWTRETGVIPGALAGVLVGMQAPGARIIGSITFIAILMTILIQVTTTKWFASKLGLLVKE